MVYRAELVRSDASWSSWDDEQAQWASSERANSNPLIGMMIVHGAEHACKVTHLSDDSLSAHIDFPLSVGDNVLVEVESLPRTEGVVSAIEGDLAVVLFVVPQSAFEPIGRAAHPDFHHREPRFGLIEPARLRVGTSLLLVRTLDMSLSGVKLDISNALTPGDARSILAPDAVALLNIRGMTRPKLGRIRWLGVGKAGFRFDEALKIEEIKCILRHEEPISRMTCLSWHAANNDRGRCH